MEIISEDKLKCDSMSLSNFTDSEGSEYKVRRATYGDMASILQLYTSAYDGTYPDPTFTDVSLLRNAILGNKTDIYVATNELGKVVASILFKYDAENLLGKAGAAVVDPICRGKKLTQKLIKFGIKDINERTNGLDVIYVTSRTVHKAAQILTLKMGFKQIGIFPNVHKTKDYETHALAAMHFNNSLSKRYVEFEQHPKVLPLYNIVRENITLPEMKEAELWDKKNYSGEVPTLEVIEAPEFVKNRMKNLVSKNEVDLAFFPFHTPTLLITSPSQNIEVFAYVNKLDQHCVITGVTIDREVSFKDLFLKVSNILRDRGIRYIEVIIRANRLNIIDKISNAKFLPCGYFPAFQLEKNQRYDYVVFSRSYEILDFENIDLTPSNEKYLKNYINLWEDTFLGSHFKNQDKNED